MTDEQQQLRDESIAIAFTAARAKLGAEHHTRLVKAWELVIDSALTVHADGSATASGTGEKGYAVDGNVCDCVDHTSGKAVAGLCKHVLALALHKRAAQKFAQLSQAQTPAAQAAPAVAETLPEAPISICMKGTLAGVPGTLVTLRGRDMREIEIRADQVRAGAACVAGIFDVGTAPQPSSPAADVASEAPMCPDHHTDMKPSQYGGWYCPHAVGDGYCQQKVKARKRPAWTPPAAAGMY